MCMLHNKCYATIHNILPRHTVSHYTIADLEETQFCVNHPTIHIFGA